MHQAFTIALTLLSTGVALMFANKVFQQYRTRHRPHQRWWSLGLLFFACGTFSEFLAQFFGWNEAIYRSYYLFGALFGVAWLGMGTAYLLMPKRAADVLLGFLILLSLIGTGAVLFSPLHHDVIEAMNRSGSVMTGAWDFFPVTLLVIIFNTFGTIFMVGGALWSAFLLARKKIMPYRVVANVWIAVGTLIVASVGTLARFGIPELLALGNMLGMTVIFIGFLKSTEQPRVTAPVQQPARPS